MKNKLLRSLMKAEEEVGEEVPQEAVAEEDRTKRILN
ncbi:hypothetical protein A2U01_0103653, partial [Trifolium medium]|nr:hypothetical protein [Trifolium medium]